MQYMVSCIGSFIESTIGKLVILFTFIGCIYGFCRFWTKIISPRTQKSRLKKLYNLIEDWFDTIDINLEEKINISLLNNKENKIGSYIEDNKLSTHKLKFSKRFRKKFLKFCGIKKFLRNNKELFTKYSRCPADEIYLDIFWNCLVADFYKFYGKYSEKSENANFADIDMKIKVLKMYLGIKQQ